MAANSTPKNRSYKIREDMGGHGHDVYGSWRAVLAEETDHTRHLGLVLDQEVTLTSTSNAGFSGIVVSGRTASGQTFHGVSLGLFHLI